LEALAKNYKREQDLKLYNAWRGMKALAKENYTTESNIERFKLETTGTIMLFKVTNSSYFTINKFTDYIFII